MLETLKKADFAPGEKLHISLRKGERITDFIDNESKVVIINSGKILVYTEENCKLLLNTLKKGDIFGLSNLYLPHTLPTTLEAGVKSTLTAISKKSIREMMERKPEMMRRYNLFCNRKLEFLLSRIATLTEDSAEQKLCRYLSIHQKDGIVTFTSKEALAKSLGIGRSTLFRQIEALQQQGVIEELSTHKWSVNTTLPGGYLS